MLTDCMVERGSIGPAADNSGTTLGRPVAAAHVEIMFYLRDLPKYDAIRARASRYPEVQAAAVEAFLVLLRTGSDVLAALERFLSSHDLSMGSWTVLMVLNRDPAVPLMPSDLANKCGVTRATMTGLLDGLERKRLVRREPEPSDRRTLRVRLTREGVDRLDGMTHDYYRRVALLMRDLNDDDKRLLSDMLLRVLANVGDVSAEAVMPAITNGDESANRIT
jgi:DNA-binding MarR family transcriptional regulator